MRSFATVARLGATFAILAACVLGFQRDSPLPKAEAAMQQGKLYVGVGACVQCHEKPSDRSSTDFCLLNEYEIWEKQDKHSQAYKVLLNDRSKRMGQIMGVADVAKDVRCLACHAVVCDEKQQGRGFRLDDGVSCDACHGPSGAWLTAHWIDPNWRTMSPEKKESEYGMKDVRDPVKRAEMCLSCHVGATDEGKVITHEMYAAGHPPLPGFEIETFVDAEPKHWRYLGSKPESIQKLFDYDPKLLHRTRLVAIGGVVALREAVALIGSQAGKTGADTPPWPELALFDCYACHHDLSVPSKSWRLMRGFPGIPGRPQPREWVSALALLGLRHVGTDRKALDAALEPLHQALEARPYGKAADVAQAADGFVQWIDPLIAKLEGDSFDEASGQKLLDEICQIVAEETPDYDSARQFAWAFRMIHHEAGGGSKPAIDATLAQLSDELRLELPAGLKNQIDQLLPKTLEAIASYDPATFKAKFGELATQLRSQ